MPTELPTEMPTTMPTQVCEDLVEYSAQLKSLLPAQSLHILLISSELANRILSDVQPPTAMPTQAPSEQPTMSPTEVLHRITF